MTFNTVSIIFNMSIIKSWPQEFFVLYYTTVSRVIKRIKREDEKWYCKTWPLNSWLEQFLNKLEGEVVAIIPNVRPKWLLMGATAVLDFLFIVEKVGWGKYYKKIEWKDEKWYFKTPLFLKGPDKSRGSYVFSND